MEAEHYLAGDRFFVCLLEWDIEQYFPNTYFEWFAFNKEEEDFIVCIESICVALGAYPLNIEGNPAYKSEWKATLMSLRHNCK